MDIQLIDDYIHVRDRVEETAAGLVLPTTVKQQTTAKMGVVLGVGPGRPMTPDEFNALSEMFEHDMTKFTQFKRDPRGALLMPVPCEVGDTIVYHRAMSVEMDGPGAKTTYMTKGEWVVCRVPNPKPEGDASVPVARIC